MSEAERIARALKGRRSNRGWTAHCPCPNHSHGDKNPSLSISDGDEGKLLLKCFKGGTFDEVMAALRASGIIDRGPRQYRPDPFVSIFAAAARPARADYSLEETFDMPKAKTYDFPRKPFILNEWDRHHIYTDESGTPVRLVAVKRLSDTDKMVRQFGRLQDGTWDMEADKGPMVPYQLLVLLAAPTTTPVFICEGERDVDTLAGFGHLATTNPNGAKSWSSDLNKYIAGRPVIIVPDADLPGMERIADLYSKLKDVAASFRVVSLGFEIKANHGEDITDWIEKHGHTNEEFIELAKKADEYRPEEEANQDAWEEAAPLKLIFSSSAFIAGFVPPDYLIDGLIQRRFCYSLTAPTGTGKTAVALLLSACIALGRAIGEYQVERGRVLYLAGENPDDVRMRWLAMADAVDFDIDTIDVHFLPGVYRLSEIGPRIKKEVEEIGPIDFLIVDTSAAYFEGEDENSNTQMGAHARRMRELVKLPGGPCVLVACHPVKNPSADNILPRGGGAFLAEVDGNLTLSKNDSVVTMHHQGKFRGPDFAPIPFLLSSATTEMLLDSKGRKIPTVIAKAMSESERGEAEASTREDEDALLIAIADNDRASQAGLASILGWVSEKGPNKAKVNRCAKQLRKWKFLRQDRDLTLTDKGKEEVKRLKLNRDLAGAKYG